MRRFRLALVALAILAAGVVTGVLYQAESPAEAQPAQLHIEVASTVGLVDANGEAGILPFGDKPFLLNFWATWCPPCRHELPLLDNVNDECPGSVVAVAVDDFDAATGYMAQEGFAMQHLIAGLEGGVSLSEAFGNEGLLMPFSAMVDDTGQIAATKQGPFASEQEIKEFMQLAPGFDSCPI